MISGFIKKYQGMPIQAKASLWYTLCNILQKGIAFIVIPIYTRVLTEGEYGQYSLFQSWCNILIILATLNLYCGVFTKAMIDLEDDRDRYTSSMQGLSTLITLIFFGIYLIGSSFWRNLLKMDPVTVYLMFLYFLTFPSFSFWSVRQRVEYRYMKMIAATLLSSVLTPLVSLFLLFFTSLRANAVIWGFLSIQILFGGFFYIYHFVKSPVVYVKEYWVHGLTFNIPLIPHYLSLIVLGQSDRIMIDAFCGEAKTGIYSLAYQVSMIMNIFVGAINNSLVPWLYAKLREKDYASMKKYCNLLCILLGVMTLGAILVAPEIVLILGTREYLEAVWVIPAVAISVYFTFCYGLFSAVEFYYSSTKFVMVASVIGAMLNVVLNYIFIPIFGFIAAGYTTLVCYFVFMVMHYLFMKKISRQHMDNEPVFDNRFIFISCLLLCIGAVIIAMMYNAMVLRLLLVLAIGVGAVLFRKKLIALIRFKGM